MEIPGVMNPAVVIPDTKDHAAAIPGVKDLAVVIPAMKDLTSMGIKHYSYDFCLPFGIVRLPRRCSVLCRLHCMAWPGLVRRARVGGPWGSSPPPL